MYVCISNRLFVCKVFFVHRTMFLCFLKKKLSKLILMAISIKETMFKELFVFLLNKRPIQLPLPFICSPYRYMPTVFDRKKYMSTNFRILFALRRRLLVTKIEATFVCFLVFSALKVVCTASLTSFN